MCVGGQSLHDSGKGGCMSIDVVVLVGCDSVCAYCASRLSCMEACRVADC